jgi:uncharacterized protein (UPF0147 family)
MEQLNQVIEVLEELMEDPQTSKNAKASIKIAITELQNNSESKAAIHKALNALDDLADDSNLESYSRSQIYNIVGLLESLAI